MLLLKPSLCSGAPANARFSTWELMERSIREVITMNMNCQLDFVGSKCFSAWRFDENGFVASPEHSVLFGVMQMESMKDFFVEFASGHLFLDFDSTRHPIVLFLNSYHLKQKMRCNFTVNLPTNVHMNISRVLMPCRFSFTLNTMVRYIQLIVFPMAQIARVLILLLVPCWFLLYNYYNIANWNHPTKLTASLWELTTVFLECDTVVW